MLAPGTAWVSAHHGHHHPATSQPPRLSLVRPRACAIPWGGENGAGGLLLLDRGTQWGHHHSRRVLFTLVASQHPHTLCEQELDFSSRSIALQFSRQPSRLILCEGSRAGTSACISACPLPGRGFACADLLFLTLGWRSQPSAFFGATCLCGSSSRRFGCIRILLPVSS